VPRHTAQAALVGALKAPPDRCAANTHSACTQCCPSTRRAATQQKVIQAPRLKLTLLRRMDQAHGADMRPDPRCPPT
jgi:hypothetical protein